MRYIPPTILFSDAHLQQLHSLIQRTRFTARIHLHGQLDQRLQLPDDDRKLLGDWAQLQYYPKFGRNVVESIGSGMRSCLGSDILESKPLCMCPIDLIAVRSRHQREGDN